jgi:hypothetical protein
MEAFGWDHNHWRLHQQWIDFFQNNSFANVVKRKMATTEEVENAEGSKYKIVSNRLEDILQCSQGLGQRIVVTSATYPYHVEWINSEWSKACGWQSDEILGTINSTSNSWMSSNSNNAGNLLFSKVSIASFYKVMLLTKEKSLTSWQSCSAPVVTQT